eukprot:29721-Pelagococcus_subviridis.AAC.6
MIARVVLRDHPRVIAVQRLRRPVRISRAGRRERAVRRRRHRRRGHLAQELALDVILRALPRRRNLPHAAGNVHVRARDRHEPFIADDGLQAVRLVVRRALHVVRVAPVELRGRARARGVRADAREFDRVRSLLSLPLGVRVGAVPHGRRRDLAIEDAVLLVHL